MSPGGQEACETLAGIATHHGIEQESDDGQSSDLSAGPHQRVRAEAKQALVKSRARMVKNHNRQSKVRSFTVGSAVGVRVDRSDRGSVDRRLIPCLVVHVNGRGQCQLRSEQGLLQTKYYPDDLAPYPADYHFSFTALDTLEGVPRIKLVTASRLQSYARVDAVSCGCTSLKCRTLQCKCYAAGVDCTSRCHRGKKCGHMAKP